jgi:hypothetical protein
MSARPVTLIDYGANWAYFIGTAEASSPDSSAWRRTTFNDGLWPRGQAPVGYATSPNNPAEESLVTVLPSSQQANYRCVFLRHAFSLNNPAAVRELTLTVNVDDGFIAWINGQFAGSYNVPGNELPFDAAASAALEPAVVSITITNFQPALIAGTNILAIQLFNANLTSSDLVFDAAMSSDNDETAPQLIEITPPADRTVRELTSIEVLFDENVTGVEAADLHINGTPATQYTEVSPRNYVFGFAQPQAGTVTVAWTQGHGITDLAGNPFSGSPWDYILDPSLPPASIVISECSNCTTPAVKR